MRKGLEFVILCSNRWLQIELTARQKSVVSRCPLFRVVMVEYNTYNEYVHSHTFTLRERQGDWQRVDGRTVRQTNEQKNGRTNGQTGRQTDGRTDKQTDRQMDRQADRQTDEQTDIQTDRQTDRQASFTVPGCPAPALLFGFLFEPVEISSGNQMKCHLTFHTLVYGVVVCFSCSG